MTTDTFGIDHYKVRVRENRLPDGLLDLLSAITIEQRLTKAIG